MDREAERTANREKNARRKAARSRTSYAEHGKELRSALGGAFGKAPPGVYNACAEGTSAPKRAEHDIPQQKVGK